MQFTYSSYRDLTALLREQGYAICSYHNYEAQRRCAILRHDIDNSPEAALRLAETEAEASVFSTWFVMVTSDLYNPASARNLAALSALRRMGHEIGLHFDEKAYGDSLPPARLVPAIQREAGILSDILGEPVTTVSMHRPSRQTLEADLRIPGMVNSYGHTFFRDFKYLSDSRRRWREPVCEIIRSRAHERLHILTHAFWYHEREQSIGETVGRFVRGANRERYEQLRGNITDLASILPEVD